MIIYRYVLLGISAFLLIAYTIFGLGVDLTPVSFVFVIVANIYMILRSRRNFLLFIVAFIIFFCNYSIIYANYTDAIVNVFTIPLSEQSFVCSLNILTLFNILLFWFVRWDYVPTGFKENVFVEGDRYNRVILFLIYALLVPIFFLGFTIPEVEGQRGTPSTAYEYSAILFLLFFYYSGNNKLHTRIGLGLVGVFSLQSLVFGGRIEAIQFLLVAYIMLFMHKISMTKVLIAMGGVFVLMSIIGVVRGELLSGNADVGTILSSLAKSGFALDTAYSAYYTSESFIYVLDRFTFHETIIFFWEFVKSVFIGTNPDMLLTSISEEYVKHYGGGLMPFYFYFYLGVIGIVVSAFIVSLYLNIVINLNCYTSGFFKCLSIWVLSTTFRWYLYTPLPLLRGVLFLTIAYYAFAYLHYQINRLSIFQYISNGEGRSIKLDNESVN